MISRTFDGIDNPTSVMSADGERTYSGDVKTLFPLIVYSQMEVVHIADDHQAQLRLIDAFFDDHQFKQVIQSIGRALSENDQRIARSLIAQETRASLKRDHDTISEQLREVDGQLKNPLFTQVQASEKTKARLQKALSAVADIQRELERSGSAIDSLPVPAAVTTEGEIAEALLRSAEAAKEGPTVSDCLRRKPVKQSS